MAKGLAVKSKKYSKFSSPSFFKSMDIFEKQQNVEAIRAIVKARWFFASIVFLQGVTVKLFFSRIPLATTPTLSLILLSAFVFNLGYWMYLRRPPEKMSNWGLNTVKVLQILMDMIWVSLILYFSGTVGKMVILFYFVSIMIGAGLYRKKGVVFSTLLAQLLFTILITLQYKGLMRTEIPTQEVFGTEFKVGDKQVLFFLSIAFYSYSLAVAVFAGYLAGLFKQREKRLMVQKNELVEKTEVLTSQTQELTQAKDEIQGALVISDVAKRAATQSRDEAEKANLELKKKIDELEKFYKITVGREVRMVELKEKIKELEGKIKKEEDSKP